METNEIDILAFPVLGDFQQIDDTKETRLSRQLWSDIRKADRLDRIDFNFTFFHTVPGAHSYVRTLPYSDTTGDFSATNSLAKPLGENHEESVHWPAAGGGCLPNALWPRHHDRPRG
jgi:hypothetical protein